MPLCRECGGQFSSEASFVLIVVSQSPTAHSRRPERLTNRTSLNPLKGIRTGLPPRQNLEPSPLSVTWPHLPASSCRSATFSALWSSGYQASRLPIYRLSRQRSVELPDKPDPVSYCFGRPYNSADRHTIDYSRGSRRHSSHNNRGGARQRR